MKCGRRDVAKVSLFVLMALVLLVVLVSSASDVQAQAVYYLGPGMYWEGIVANSAVSNSVQGSFIPVDPVVGFVIQYGSFVGDGHNPRISTAWGWEPYRITNEVTSQPWLLGQTTCTGYGGPDNYVQQYVCPVLAPGALQYLYVPNWQPVPPGNVTYFGGKCELQDEVTYALIDCFWNGTIYPIYYGEPATPTPTATLFIPPSPTTEPCPFQPFDNGYVWDINYNYNIWSPPVGAEDVQVYFDQETVLVFADETLVIPAMTWKSVDKPIGGFSCFAEVGVCDAGQYQYQPTVCYGDGTVDFPEFAIDDFVSFGIVGTTCLIDFQFSAFNLQDNVISSFVDTFGLEVPAWGWTAGQWLICADRYGFTKLEIGSIDLLFYVDLLLSALILMLIGFFVRR